MRQPSRRELILLGAGAALTGLAPEALSAASRMRFTKYEIFPTRVPMVDRVREAWIASYKLQ
ncbi:MAG TPA: hypothetical protein VFB63_04110, partial [Bryobacteraceae bacterium]|nr:hypothetical protein [Bryobacteraceae bacterium]